MSRVVIVPDPDNERGVRVVDEGSGRVLAAGHLVVDVPALFTDRADRGEPLSAGVRFVESVG